MKALKGIISIATCLVAMNSSVARADVVITDEKGASSFLIKVNYDEKADIVKFSTCSVYETSKCRPLGNEEGYPSALINRVKKNQKLQRNVEFGVGAVFIPLNIAFMGGVTYGLVLSGGALIPVGVALAAGYSAMFYEGAVQSYQIIKAHNQMYMTLKVSTQKKDSVMKVSSLEEFEKNLIQSLR